jgi:hypothetical protein
MRAASGIQRYGSAQMAAPYSLMARSKQASGRPVSSALPWISGEVEVVLVLEAARRLQLSAFGTRRVPLTERYLGLWPSGDLCGESVTSPWQNVCRPRTGRS